MTTTPRLSDQMRDMEKRLRWEGEPVFADELAALIAAVERLEQENDELLVALKCCVDSAFPHPVEHPGMRKAWRLAEQVIANCERAALRGQDR